MWVSARLALLCLALPSARAGYVDTKYDAVQNSSQTIDVIYELSDEEYYAMPELFQLDDYESCLGQRGIYCVGSFELSAPPGHQLFQRMVGWSNNWVDNYNHTRVHRGLCVSKQCPKVSSYDEHFDTWFESCVNAQMSSYNMSAHLYQLDYCKRGNDVSPMSSNQRAFAAVFAVLFALAAISAGLDLTLNDKAKKDLGWALSWSILRSWRTLAASPPASSATDLRTFDGLRVFCMMSIILEHVCWLATQSYVSNTRYMEQTRRVLDVVLLTNSTLVVQIYFVMSSFLLAHKLLLQKKKAPICKTFFETMINRIIRLSPSNFMVIWFASSWWERLSDGPLWTPLITGEASTCRHKWWTHLLYLNNIIYPNEKCLIQTWYLAADMQLYAMALLLTLLLRGRRSAVLILTALFFFVTSLNFTFAYLWHLVPTFVLHRPELVRTGYAGDTSFNVLYQSPFGNAAASIGGLLFAHLHHYLQADGIRLADSKVFRWISINAVVGAVCWAGLSPLLIGDGQPNRFSAAALAALERPVFVLLVTVALLGAINGIKSPWRTCLSHMGNVVPRLSFGALLLHLCINKALLATRTSPLQLDRPYSIPLCFGVGVISYAIAFPLALLVEIPTQALYKELRRPREPSKPAIDPTQEKLDKNENN